MSSANVAEFELKSITPLQRSMHEANPEDVDEEIQSDHTYEYMKTTPNLRYLHEVKRTDADKGSGSAEYVFDRKFHFANYSYLTVKIPIVQVKKGLEGKVQISLCDNIFNHIIQNGHLCSNGDIIESLNTVSLDNYGQFDLIPGESKRALHQKLIGYGKRWDNYTPSLKLKCYLPFDYCSHAKKSIPLCLCSHSKITHRFDYNLKMSSLVRTRVLNNGTWKQIPFNQALIQVRNEDDLTIPFPNLYCKYGHGSEAEIKWRREHPHEYYIQNIIYKESDKVVKYGQADTIPIQSPHPVTRFRWGLINLNAQNLNILSNYTTDIHNPDQGEDPIISNGIKRQEDVRLPELDSDHFSGMEALVG